MFKTQSSIKCYSYSIDLIEVLSPFIELIKDIVSYEKKKPYSIIDIINFEEIDIEFYKKINGLHSEQYSYNKLLKFNKKKNKISHPNLYQIEKQKELIEKQKELENLALEILSSYFLKIVFSNENIDNQSNTIFIQKSEKNIVLENSKNPNDSIINILSKFGILSKFIEQIKNDLGRECIRKLTKFDNEYLFKANKSVICELKSNLNCPVIEIKFLNETIIQKDFAEQEDIWINENLYKKKYYPDNNSGEINLLKKGTQIIGFCKNDKAFLYTKDVDILIKEELILDYYWLLLKRNIYRKSIVDLNENSQLVSEFNIEITNEDFTNMLSNLKKNLYISGIDIPEVYEKYFEKGISLRELKHITGYEFFLPDMMDEKGSLLGIYHEDKPRNENHYNLIHWFCNDNEKNIQQFTKETPVRLKKSTISILKPEISFYFRHKFYEDFFEKILVCIEGIEYLSNYTLEYADNTECEIDFLIKTPTKIFFIETKTKLNSNVIDGFEKKCSKLNNEMSSINRNVEFMIIGAFSDESCNKYKFYIERDKTKHDKYNENRENLSIIPYWFDIPISNSNKILTCIAEPSFEKLKDIILEKCKD